MYNVLSSPRVSAHIQIQCYLVPISHLKDAIDRASAIGTNRAMAFGSNLRVSSEIPKPEDERQSQTQTINNTLASTVNKE